MFWVVWWLFWLIRLLYWLVLRAGIYVSDLFPIALGGFSESSCNEAVIESTNLGSSFANSVY